MNGSENESGNGSGNENMNENGSANGVTVNGTPIHVTASEILIATAGDSW